jgi:5-methylthioadenosine/S-adenosylhomocysteine deaminase
VYNGKKKITKWIKIWVIKMESKRKKKVVITIILSIIIIIPSIFVYRYYFKPTINSNEIDYILKGKIVTMENETSIIPSGNIFVKNGKIEAIWETGMSPPQNLDMSNIPIIDTKGIIFPGLIDCHNHPFYNSLPIWNTSELYSNRYKWKEADSYNSYVEYPIEILTRNNYENLLIETVKYSEVKALIGGTTSIQGANIDQKSYASSIIRNIELSNFGDDKIMQNVGPVNNWDETEILKEYQSGKLDAFFGHIGEGTDELSKNEFFTLKEKNLLIEPMVAIHALAFNKTMFAEMASVGAKMVWSPTSNLLLYGTTADVKSAWEEGVCVALSPDWTPSGTKNVLGELKIADQWNKNKLGGYFSEYNLTQMVTTNAAKICGWDSYLGKIKEGYYADLLIIDDWNASSGYSPYRALISAIDFDVKLVTVEGDPLYGLSEYFDEIKPGDYEIITYNGWKRAIDITNKNVPSGNQLFSDINNTLNNVDFTSWTGESFPDGLKSIKISPINTYGDKDFFNAIDTSDNFNLNFTYDLMSYYNRNP